MKKLLVLFFLMIVSLVGLGQIKYPIQTIYKGDSVVILSIKQSIDINRAIDAQKKIIREQARKINALNGKIDSLNVIIAGIPSLTEDLQYRFDTTYKWAEELNLTIWEYATNGAFMYVVPPYNKVFFINLDDYNFYSDDYGKVFLFEKMTNQEYIEYKKDREKYDKLYPPVVYYFKNYQFTNFENFARQSERWIWKNKNLLEKELKKK